MFLGEIKKKNKKVLQGYPHRWAFNYATSIRMRKYKDKKLTVVFDVSLLVNLHVYV